MAGKIRARDAEALLEAGIAECRAQKRSAAVLLGAAENIFSKIGDSWNAGIARQWADIARLTIR